ncbi:MAG: formimidoylglutamate deiminase [Kordiimonadales bacterium]|nr:MAG: formimidoylglutamate deiminase [Kordiimonadales bacterium]
MQKLFFSEGLLASGWAEGICLGIDATGMLTSVEVGVEAPDGIRAFGPVLPAMSNLHSHAFQRAFAGLAEYKAPGQSDFWSWRKAMYGFAGQMTPAHQQAIAAALYVEMLKAGYSAVGEFHYLHGADQDQALDTSEAVIAAADETGIALTHLPVLYEASGFGGAAPLQEQQPFVHSADEFIRLLNVLAPRLAGKHKLGVAFHSLRAVKEASFAPVIEALEKISLTAPFHIHIAEQQGEVEASVAYNGKRPIEWLLDTQPVDARWCLIHSTHLIEDERDRLAKTGAVVGLCPTTEANLGDGMFPLPEYLAEGGAWGIGSDSHISVDAREELRLLEYGQRLARQSRTVLTPNGGGHTGEYLWSAAAKGGAQALAQPIGEIAVGKRADLLVLDSDALSLVGAAGVQKLDAMIFAGQPSPITDVMVAGTWVVTNGKHFAEDAVFERYKSVMGKLTEHVESPR